MPKFSIILPEHNSEKFMRRMLDSIRTQTFQDYELIVACDRCTDNTADIAMQYIRNGSQDRVLEVDFGRCSLTRNAALDIAKGDWILFADDDDWFLHDYAFEMIAAECQDDVDVVAFGFLARNFCNQPGLQCFYSAEDNMAPIMRVWAAPWTKAWRMDFIGEHRFPDIAHSDDLPFTNEMMALVNNMQVIYQPFYFYNFMRPGSIQDKLSTGELEAIG